MLQMFNNTKLFFYCSLFILAFICILALQSCKKETVDTVEFEFTHLTASDTLMQSRSFIGITAHTSGSIKEFLWDAKDKNGTSAGAFFGSGNVVEWHICCADTFYINCSAVGHNNESISKSIKIISYD
jgi:hypothetical protein